MKLTKRHTVLLLGSNIEPEIHLPKAIELLNRRFRILKISNVWETPAVGSDGPDFLNAAVLLETNLSPQVLKTRVLRPLEVHLGRVRVPDKNAPRTIDIDVVIRGAHTCDDEIWKHEHAAIPVAELVPHLRNHPFETTLGEVARKLQTESPIRLRPDISQLVKSLIDLIPSRSRIPA